MIPRLEIMWFPWFNWLQKFSAPRSDLCLWIQIQMSPENHSRSEAISNSDTYYVLTTFLNKSWKSSGIRDCAFHRCSLFFFELRPCSFLYDIFLEIDNSDVFHSWWWMFHTSQSQWHVRIHQTEEFKSFILRENMFTFSWLSWDKFNNGRILRVFGVWGAKCWSYSRSKRNYRIKVL